MADVISKANRSISPCQSALSLNMQASFWIKIIPIFSCSISERGVAI